MKKRDKINKKQMTKKQHYVPRMYLKRWKTEDGNLFVITKDTQDKKIKKVTIDDSLFYKPYCYDIILPDGTPWTKNEVEDGLGNFEDRHARLLNRIIQCCDNGTIVLNNKENRTKDFLEFVYLMVLRSPYYNIPFTLDGVETTVSELDMVLQQMFGDKWNLLNARTLVFNSHNKQFLNESVDDLLKRPFPKILFLKAPDDVSFVTSDNPAMCICNKNDIKQPLNKPDSLPVDLIYIPISPRYASVLIYRDCKQIPYVKKTVSILSKDNVKMFNRMYWKSDDPFTVVSNNKMDLIDILQNGLILF